MRCTRSPGKYHRRGIRDADEARTVARSRVKPNLDGERRRRDLEAGHTKITRRHRDITRWPIATVTLVSNHLVLRHTRDSPSVLLLATETTIMLSRRITRLLIPTFPYVQSSIHPQISLRLPRRQLKSARTYATTADVPSSPITPIEKIILDTIKVLVRIMVIKSWYWYRNDFHQANGPISFATYMNLCLSHPIHGYYMNPSNTVFGTRGDFITSPEISQVFGEVCFWLPYPLVVPVRL